MHAESERTREAESHTHTNNTHVHRHIQRTSTNTCTLVELPIVSHCWPSFDIFSNPFFLSVYLHPLWIIHTHPEVYESFQLSSSGREGPITGTQLFSKRNGMLLSTQRRKSKKIRQKGKLENEISGVQWSLTSLWKHISRLILQYSSPQEVKMIEYCSG